MLIGHNTLTHRGPDKRDLRALDKCTHLVLCLRPGHAFTDEGKRAFGLLKKIERCLDILGWRDCPQWFRYALNFQDIREIAFPADDVVREIQIAGARPAVN